MKIGFQRQLFLCFLGILLFAMLPLAILLFTTPADTLGQLITESRLALLIVLLLSVLIALVLSLIIARRFAYPVHVMTRIANKMAQMDFREKVKITTHDEHAELARSLNQMSLELERRIREVSRVNSELEATFSSMKEGILVVNRDGKIVQLNKACREMFGLESNPVARAALEALRSVPLHDMIDSVLNQGKPVTGELHLNEAGPLIVSVNINALKQADDIQGAVAVFHDVTELRRLERMRHDFVANVSHELKTPLTSIKGFAETLLQADEGDIALLKKNIEIIHRKSVDLEMLISDLLDLAAIESGEIRMKKEPIPLKAFFQTAVDELQKLINEKNLRVSIVLEHVPTTISADKRWIHQALLNLLTNACNYTNPGGSITISASPEGRFTRIQIADTGMGISETDIPRIFERFYRTDKARTRLTGGTGLGLSIVKHIVEAHQGRIAVSSELAKGSTFSIYLPQ